MRKKSSSIIAVAEYRPPLGRRSPLTSHFSLLTLLAFSFLSFLFLSSCSINRLAVRTVANVLAGSGGGSANAFAADDDPELVGSALPFALKTFETLLTQDPTNSSLALATGSAFVMYANAFVQEPASMFPVERLDERRSEFARAKKLYLRGRDYVLGGIETRHPGFKAALVQKEPSAFLAKMVKDDVPYLYWGAAAWTAAFSLDPMDLEFMTTVPMAAAMMARAYELQPEFNGGAIYDFYISFDAGMPSSLGGNASRVDEMFAKSVEVSGGKSASPFLSYAVAVCIASQDVARFKQLLQKALSVDVAQANENRLANVIAQRKARWYLDHLDSYFIDTGEETP